MKRKVGYPLILKMLFTILLMDNTMLIQLTNKKAVRILHGLEELHLIKVLKENIADVNPKLSDKYKGIISKEEG